MLVQFHVYMGLLFVLILQVVEVTPFMAVLQWVAPDLGEHQEELPVTELRYEVFLNDSPYTTIHTTQLSITDLKPATDYRVLWV